jgi:hypothetical protein
VDSESSEREWVSRQGKQRTKKGPLERLPILRCSPNQPPVCASIRSERLHRGSKGSFQQNGPAAIERMRERRLWLNELQSMLGKRKPRKKRRSGGKRVDCRTHVMNEAWKREFRGTSAAADGLASLAYKH